MAVQCEQRFEYSLRECSSDEVQSPRWVQHGGVSTRDDPENPARLLRGGGVPSDREQKGYDREQKAFHGHGPSTMQTGLCQRRDRRSRVGKAGAGRIGCNTRAPSKKMRGGIEPDFIKVPRQWFMVDVDNFRCACVMI
jgi:hypothetical protein